MKHFFALAIALLGTLSICHGQASYKDGVYRHHGGDLELLRIKMLDSVFACNVQGISIDHDIDQNGDTSIYQYRLSATGTNGILWNIYLRNDSFMVPVDVFKISPSGTTTYYHTHLLISGQKEYWTALKRLFIKYTK